MRHLTLAAALLASATLLAACGDDDDDGGGGGTPAKAFVRVAHLAPDAPAVDFCLAPAGTTTFTGPVFKGLGGTGAADGVSFGQVTRYIEVDAAEYDVRLVAPNAADCTTPLTGLTDFTSPPALAAGAYVTLAAIGDLALGGEDFQLKGFVDRTAAPPAGSVAVRFVHASPDTGPVDVGLLAGGTFTPIFTDVAFGEFDASPGTGFTADAQGFVTAPALTAGTNLSARPAGTDVDALVVRLTVGLPAGSIASVFATGYSGGGDPALGGDRVHRHDARDRHPEPLDVPEPHPRALIARAWTRAPAPARRGLVVPRSTGAGRSPRRWRAGASSGTESGHERAEGDDHAARGRAARRRATSGSTGATWRRRRAGSRRATRWRWWTGAAGSWARPSGRSGPRSRCGW